MLILTVIKFNDQVVHLPHIASHAAPAQLFKAITTASPMEGRLTNVALGFLGQR